MVILNFTFPKANAWLPGHKRGLTSVPPILVNVYPTRHTSLGSIYRTFSKSQSFSTPKALLFQAAIISPWNSVIVSQLDFLLLLDSIPFNLLSQHPQICLIHKSHHSLACKIPIASHHTQTKTQTLTDFTRSRPFWLVWLLMPSTLCLSVCLSLSLSMLQLSPWFSFCSFNTSCWFLM